MSFRIRSGLVLMASVALAIAIPVGRTADAQILNRIKKAAERAAERETERQVDRKVTETIRCAADDAACIDRAKRDGKQVETAPSGSPSTAASAGAASGAVPAAFVNFDFVPGDRVLFAEDFSRDQVGDFPRRVEFVRGNAEVAEWQGARWLRGTTWPSVFDVVLSEALPERYTIEMEVVPGGDNRQLALRFAENAAQHVGVRYFQNRLNGGIYRGSNAIAAGSTEDVVKTATPFMLRVMVDGRYVKVYAGGTRVANVPNAEVGRSRKIRVELPGSPETPGYVRSIRIAAGGRTLYDAISADGRVATQGIYFDTNSDVVRPESAPTLTLIARMLEEHPELKLTIEGHTDDVGDDAANLRLSERRAAAVKAALERQHRIAGDRLQARGIGEAKPAASNDTPEGRQQNRRVELVKR